VSAVRRCGEKLDEPPCSSRSERTFKPQGHRADATPDAGPTPAQKSMLSKRYSIRAW
jgi:hypothetical protein